jgi:prepilin-type N-terminal cleavage/methylation domain-containing protein
VKNATIRHSHVNRPRARRAFSLVEMLIALTITSTLLTATFVALDASFMAYQKTTEVASTHTIARLTMHRMLSLLRTGTDFGPYPNDIGSETVIESEFVEFYASTGELMRLEWIPDEEALYLVRIAGDGTEDPQLLLENVTQLDEDGEIITPFTLEYRNGTQLYRATVDLTLIPDDNMSVSLDGDNQDVLRLVASAMPRNQTY